MCGGVLLAGLDCFRAVLLRFRRRRSFVGTSAAKQATNGMHEVHCFPPLGIEKPTERPVPVGNLCFPKNSIRSRFGHVTSKKALTVSAFFLRPRHQMQQNPVALHRVAPGAPDPARRRLQGRNRRQDRRGRAADRPGCAEQGRCAARSLLCPSKSPVRPQIFPASAAREFCS